MNVIVAPDKFKGSLTAGQVAEALADGLRTGRPDLTTTLLPVADGGDGTVDAAVAAGFQPVTSTVSGPTGRPVRARYAVKDSTAVVELAGSCGLALLPDGRFDPLGASTYGVGQLIGHAVDHGATEIILGVGGSASTDGGAGLAQALGARLLDREGRPLAWGGAALRDLVTIDLTDLHKRMAGVHVVVASDVDNPLLGERGAAAVFGPQKGASPDQIAILESGLRNWAAHVVADTGKAAASSPGAGAAGGTGFGALTLLGAEIRPGIDLVLGMLNFDEAIQGSDLVVTGEGSLDEQSLSGKAPIGVAAVATRAGIPTVAVAGRILLGQDRLSGAGIRAAYALADLEPDPVRSMTFPIPLLKAIGERISRDWLR